MGNRIVVREAGFSLIEVLVATGAAALLMYGLMSISQNSMKSQNNVKLTADIDNSVSAMQLQASTNCMAMLAPGSKLIPNPAATTPVTFNNAFTVPASVSTLGAHYFKSPSALPNPQPSAASYSATLALEYSKPAQSALGAMSVTRTIPLMLTVDPTQGNLITGCATAAVSADDLTVRRQACQDLGGTLDLTKNPPCFLPPPPIPPLEINPPSGNAAIGTTVTYSATGGTYPYGYSVVSGPGTLNVNTLNVTGKGTIIVQVTDSAGGTSKSTITAKGYPPGAYIGGTGCGGNGACDACYAGHTTGSDCNPLHNGGSCSVCVSGISTYNGDSCRHNHTVIGVYCQ